MGQIPVTLNGRNYQSWMKNMNLALMECGLSGFIQEGQEITPWPYQALRKPKVFALQILRRYLTKEGRVRKFSTVYMDKRTLRSKI